MQSMPRGTFVWGTGQTLEKLNVDVTCRNRECTCRRSRNMQKPCFFEGTEVSEVLEMPGLQHNQFFNQAASIE